MDFARRPHPLHHPRTRFASESKTGRPFILRGGWWRHHRPAAAFSVEGLLARIAALLCFLAFASSAFAQPIDDSINAELKDLGKLQTKIQRYNKSLGVVSQFMRSENSYVER